MIIIYDSSIDMSFALNCDNDLVMAEGRFGENVTDADVEEWDVVDPLDAIDDAELAHAERIKSALKVAGGAK